MYRIMKLTQPGAVSNMVLDRVPMKAPAAGEVLVKISACAVSYRDVLDRTGAFKFIRRPTVLGHEFVGDVAAVGEGVSASHGTKEGDTMLSLHWDQSQAWPSPLNKNGAVDTMFGLTCDGGYAEYCTAPIGSFAPVKPGTSDLNVNELACVMSTFGTVWQGAVRRGGLTKGMNVLVTGASGGVGSAAVLLAKAMGCNVTGVTSNVEKAPFIKELGADEVVVSKDGGVFKVPRPADMVIEAVGGPTFTSSLRATAPGGKMVLVGNVENSVSKLPLGLCILNSISVVGSDSIEREQLSDVLLPFMKEHGIKPKVQEVFPLERVGEAHNILEARGAQGRLVVDVTK